MTGFFKNNSKKKKNNIINSSKQKIMAQAFQFHAKGNISEAAKYYQYFISQGFHDHRVFSNYGVILRDLGKLNEARSCLKKAIEINPNYPIAYSNLGGILRDLGKLNEAELATRQAIKLNPNNVEAYSNLGGILRDLGKIKEAGSCLKKAIEINPKYSQAHLNLGGLFRTLGKFKEAELATRQAIKLNPNKAEAYSNLGGILRDLGKLKEAELATRQAIKLKPDFSDAFRDLSICFYLLKDINSALKSIINATSLDNKNIINKLLLHIFKTETTNQQNKFNKKILESKTLIFNLPVDTKLVNTLYKIESRDQEIYQGPTYGDAKGSDYKLFENSNISIKNVKEKLVKLAKDTTKSEIFISESFFTIFRSGGGLISHDHLGSIDKIEGLNIAHKKFSLVYYLKVGDQNCENPGILKLENPDQHILPTNGLVIIFPAKRKHSVFYKGQKDRIIIGMNFYKI